MSQKTAEDILKNKGNEIVCVDEKTTIHETVKLLCSHKIGAVAVVKEETIVGIWTERDLLNQVQDADFNAKTAQIGSYMTKKLFRAPHNASVYDLLDKLLGKRIRHILIYEGEKYVGIISQGDIARALMADKYQALTEKNQKISWEYYEDWKWEKHWQKQKANQQKSLRVDRIP